MTARAARLVMRLYEKSLCTSTQSVPPGYPVVMSPGAPRRNGADAGKVWAT